MSTELQRLRQEIAVAHQFLDELGVPRLSLAADPVLKVRRLLTVHGRLEVLLARLHRQGVTFEVSARL